MWTETSWYKAKKRIDASRIIIFIMLMHPQSLIQYSPWKLTGSQKERIVFQAWFSRGKLAVKLQQCTLQEIKPRRGLRNDSEQHRDTRCYLWLCGCDWTSIHSNIWMVLLITHRIHGTGIPYIYLHENHKKSTIHVAKYTVRPMDLLWVSEDFPLS